MKSVLTKLGQIALQLHQFGDLNAMLDYGVRETRTFFKSDRALIYQFLPGGDGVVAAEAVQGDWQRIIGQLIYDPCFQETWAEPYRQGRIRSIADVERSHLAPCHIKFLTGLQVKANLVVPILMHPVVGNPDTQLWGLLIVQQCSAPRQWRTTHGQVLTQIAHSIGLALQHWRLHRQLQRYPQPAAPPPALEEPRRIYRMTEAATPSGLDAAAANPQDEMLRKISQQVPGVVYQYRLYPDGRACFPYASEAIRQIYAVTPEQVKETAQPVMERLHPDDLSRVIANIHQSFQRLELWHDEYRVILPERGVRWLEGHAMPEAMADGSVLWYGYIWDITDRKTLELLLQESEAQFRGLFEQAIVGISLVSTTQQFLRVNQRFCQLMGYSAAELKQMTVQDVTYPEDIPESLSYFQQAIHGRGAARGIDKRYIRKNGQVWWGNLAISPIYSASGELQYLFGIMVDISDRKAAEAQLQQEFQRERMIHLIDHHIRQSLDIRQILQTTVHEVRQFLQTDRVIIYQLTPDWHGVVLAESVDKGWRSILDQQITDTYFVETQGENYHDNLPYAVPDIYEADFSPCHVDLLEWLQVRAKLVVPILQTAQLWGLLIAHHCQGPRQWLQTESRLLQQLSEQLAIAIQQSELHQRLQEANQVLEQLSNTDELTQIANRRRFDYALIQEWQRATQARRPLALILCDIDYFKQYNDTYGHPRGDECLVAVARALGQCIKRSVDCLARYGGEEFAAILPNTNLDGALDVVEEMQQRIAALQLEHRAHPSGGQITLSFGITVMAGQQPTANASLLLEQADRALYMAKQAGRNGYAIWNLEGLV